MTKIAVHAWAFKKQFRARAFGWKSQPAIQRIGEAVREISTVARKNPAVGAEGAVLLLERLSPALERVDSSSGAIGTAVGRAIDTLVPLIATVEVGEARRSAWLERLWAALMADEIPYLETLGDSWGELCASREVASPWADRLIHDLRVTWTLEASGLSYFKGTSVCLSALFRAERYDELRILLKLDRLNFWPHQRWGVKALAAQGEPDKALALAESLRGPWTNAHDLAQICETILCACGRVEEAYQRYAFESGQSSTFIATFRRIARQYPHKSPGELLGDLVRRTPGEEGKWFAAAKDSGLYDEALSLARRAPCDPKTLTRAARDYAASRPAFARDAGVLALHWLVQGYGYEVTSTDVLAAWTHTLAAAANLGDVEPTREALRALVASEPAGERFVSRVLARHLKG